MKKKSQINSQEKASDSVLFSAVVGLRNYWFTKKELHLKCFLGKFVKLYTILILQITAGRLLLISSNVSDISLALLAINRLNHS